MPRFFLFLGCTVAGLLLAALAITFLTPLGFVALCVYYGWIFFAFVHYRQVRQQEILHLLITAVSTQAPLAPALQAYLRDRPRTAWREFWICAMLFFVLPFILPLIYLITRRPSFDLKVYWVARLLEEGCSLHVALASVPGVVTQETLLAVTVGEQTGRLQQCLLTVPRWRFGSTVTELLPHVLYPLALLPIIFGVLAFQMIFVVPKFEKIFSDLGLRFPWLTAVFIEAARVVMRHGLLLGLIMFAAVLLAALIYSSATVRWYLPLFGRLYRMRVQSRLLNMLSVLLDAGKTLPEALETLARSRYFPPVVQDRLRDVRFAIEQGGTLPERLQRNGLLPPAMAPLLQAAERSRNLVWALGEMGLALSNRLIRVSQRLVSALFPVTVFTVGIGVGLYAVAMFLPLVEVITRLSEL